MSSVMNSRIFRRPSFTKKCAASVNQPLRKTFFGRMENSFSSGTKMTKRTSRPVRSFGKLKSWLMRELARKDEKEDDGSGARGLHEICLAKVPRLRFHHCAQTAQPIPR